MGYKLYLPEVYNLTTDIMSGNPSKKMRLDFQKKTDGNVGNEDLWGQDDLTAEEFDMLEVQATQACNQSIMYGNNQAIQNNRQSNFIEVEDLKQLQYELEGRIKLLSHSLEKTAKELNEERLNREQLIKEKMKQFNERETNLQKEVEKMQSILEFKDQEMISVYNKMQLMKSQLQARKNNVAKASIGINFEDFSKSSKFGVGEQCSKPSISKRFQRKHTLVTDTPRGETKSIDILSSILFTRLSVPLLNYEYTHYTTVLQQNISNDFSMSASVMKLKDEQKCQELLEYYNCFLKIHIAMLRDAACNAPTSNKNQLISSKRKVGYSQAIISCLQDLIYIFSCSKSNPILEEKCNYHNRSEYMDIQEVEANISVHDSPSEDDMHSFISTLSQIFQLLSELANPKTYPSGYSKNEEIELSLLVLLSVSSSNPEKFLDLIGELPIYCISRPLQKVAAICTTLKLLIILCSCKKFKSYLMHKDSNCIFCLIADFLINSVANYPEKLPVSMILIENFLSLVFSTNDFLETLLETSECICKVIQNVIISLWKYYQLREKIFQSMEIIKRGFFLLHFMSHYIPNFKERRSPVENEYISLISSILALSKENNELREFYDLIHPLWDFQADITEFDLDDSSEETQNSTDSSIVET